MMKQIGNEYLTISEYASVFFSKKHDLLFIASPYDLIFWRRRDSKAIPARFFSCYTFFSDLRNNLLCALNGRFEIVVFEVQENGVISDDPVFRYNANDRLFNPITFSKDGDLLLAVEENSVLFWDTKDWNLVRKITFNGLFLIKLALRDDGDAIAVVFFDREERDETKNNIVVVYDLHNTRVCPQKFGFSDDIRGVCFTTRDKVLIIGNNMYEWDLQTDEVYKYDYVVHKESKHFVVGDDNSLLFLTYSNSFAIYDTNCIRLIKYFLTDKQYGRLARVFETVDNKLLLYYNRGYVDELEPKLLLEKKNV